MIVWLSPPSGGLLAGEQCSQRLLIADGAAGGPAGLVSGGSYAPGWGTFVQLCACVVGLGHRAETCIEVESCLGLISQRVDPSS